MKTKTMEKLKQTQLTKVIEDLDVKLIAVDTETYYNPSNSDAIVKVIQGALNNEPFCVPIYFEHDEKPYSCYITDMAIAKEILENDKIEKIFHNFKYDYNMLLNIGITVKGKIHDTMIMINLINEEFECKTPIEDENGIHKKTKSKKLKDLAYHFLDKDSHVSEMAIKDAKMEISKIKDCKMSEISYKDIEERYPEKMQEYAINDVIYTYKLYFKFLGGVASQRLYQPMQADIEATKVIIDIERNGINIDLDTIKQDESVLTKKMEETENEIHIATGNDKVNLNSNKEVADMFSDMGVQWRWHTPTGEYNTAKSVLKTIREEYSNSDQITYVIDKLLKYRKIEKILSTYISNKYEEVHDDGRVHPSYWVIGNDYGVGGTVTGRLSSSNPNMQNLPKGDIKIDDDTYNMRKYFVADDGYVIVSMDADQQEYRLLAHYGKDKTFMNFVHQGKDIHKATASMLFDIDYENIDDATRSKAKTLNFGLVYGLGNASFAKALGYDIDEDKYRRATQYLYKRYKPWEIPPYKAVATQPMIDLTTGDLKEAVEYFFSKETQGMIKEVIQIKKKYFSRFPGINKFLKDCKKVAERRGYVKTWIGRRRHFKKPKSEGYKAPNAVIQGGCSDVLKIKLVECQEYLKDKKSCIINNVHDQIDFMIHKTELDIVTDLKEILEDTKFRVPISWGIEIGKSLGDAIPTTIETYKEDIRKYLGV